MKRKFWNWIKNEDESVPDMERTLFLNGMISDETWYGDEVTPQLFKDELNAGNGNITVWINSPGGDVFAAAQIYNMLRDYKGSVTVKIDGIAADCNGRRHGLCIPCCNDDDPQSCDHGNGRDKGYAESNRHVKRGQGIDLKCL